MKLLFNQSKITILISVILLATIGHSIDSSDKVAVIVSGPGFHHEGVRLRESLLEKNYDVHLVEVHAEGIINIEDWSKTPLGKDLDGHYKQLIFIVTAHGHEEVGAQIYWKSLLTLVKLFEQKADEIFIHLETCFSGDAAERWLPQLGNNVKVLTTSSCRGSSTLYNPSLMDWDIVNQLFTGYYLQTIGRDRAANAHKDAFEQLTCNSTVSQLALVTSAPCKRHEHKCTRLHVWKGENEELTKWDILPINLTVNFSRLPPFASDEFHKFTGDCRKERKIFDNTRDVHFSPALSIENNFVNTMDPIDAWKLRTYEIPPHAKTVFEPVPKEIKDAEITPYSLILDINGDQCKINKGTCDQKTGQQQLKSVHMMTLGSYNTREIWILKDDHYDSNEVPQENFFMNFILIPLCVLIGLGIVIGIVVFFCFRKKTRQPARQVNPNASVQIYTPPQPYMSNSV